MNDLLPARPPQATPISVTFGIIARERIPELDRLISILPTLEGPADREIVIAVETPGTTAPTETPDENGVRWIAIPVKRGLGYNRNCVLDAARGAVFVCVDDDCIPQPTWLTSLLGALGDPDVHGAVGGMRIPPAGFVGDSISALGFPAGGNAGYATIFQVDPDGTTYNISGGNCALRTSTLRTIGGYNDEMVLGGEDTELAFRFTRAGKRLVYVPAACMEHPARTNLIAFCRWQYLRGRSKHQFMRKVPSTGLVGDRLASYGRILKNNATDPKIVLIAPLLAASLILQLAGTLAEAVRPTPPPPELPVTSGSRS